MTASSDLPRWLVRWSDHLDRGYDGGAEASTRGKRPPGHEESEFTGRAYVRRLGVVRYNGEHATNCER